MENIILSVSIILLITLLIVIWVLRRYKILDIPVVLAMTISSFAVSTIFPALFFYWGIWVIVPVTVIAFLLAAVINIMDAPPDKEYEETYGSRVLAIIGCLAFNGTLREKLGAIFDNRRTFKNITGSEKEKEGSRIFEKSVDSTRNTDKMGIDECINSAFSLKKSGDLQGAIQQYFYGLDNNPDRNLVLWIVLDICALYKELEQPDLARSVLEKYAKLYGDIINLSVKMEIESNL